MTDEPARMGVFDRFRTPPRTYDDPTFGALKYERRFWTGHVAFPPTNDEVMILIDANGGDPSEAHRRLFLELIERYASLTPSIAEALFSLWEPCLEGWDGDAPPVVTSVADMLRHCELDSIDLGPSSRITLGYGFTEDVGWDDAMFSVHIDAWRVSPGSLDD